VLDSHNRNGELVFSDDEDLGGAEGGEDEYEENEPVAFDEDMMEEMRMRGIHPRDYMKTFAAGEGGEDDQNDEYSSEKDADEG
jgi:hypothetical protein